jgi:hypothetical protein
LVLDAWPLARLRWIGALISIAGLQADEFLVSVTGNAEEVAAAREMLQNSGEIELETDVAAEAARSGGEGSEGRRKKHSPS